MTFNLKKILRALLFSTSDALSIRDIQAVITRYHQQVRQEPEEPEESAEEAIELTPVGTQTVAVTTEEGGEVSQAEIGEIMQQVPSLLTATQIRDAMDAIAGELIEAGEVYRLIQSPAGYRITVAPEYAEWVRLLRNEARPARLSQAAMETLAIIAYRQPVTRAEIEAIRGVSADGAVSRLLEHDLILVTGRADLPGRPIQYGSSDKFLEYTGIRSIEELPASDVLSPSQLTEWIRQATQQSERPADRDVGLPSNADETEVSIDAEGEEFAFEQAGQTLETPDSGQYAADASDSGEPGEDASDSGEPGEDASDSGEPGEDASDSGEPGEDAFTPGEPDAKGI